MVLLNVDQHEIWNRMIYYTPNFDRKWILLNISRRCASSNMRIQPKLLFSQTLGTFQIGEEFNTAECLIVDGTIKLVARTHINVDSSKLGR